MDCIEKKAAERAVRELVESGIEPKYLSLIADVVESLGATTEQACYLLRMGNRAFAERKPGRYPQPAELVFDWTEIDTEDECGLCEECDEECRDSLARLARLTSWKKEG